MATLIAQFEQGIESDAFEQDVLRTARKLAIDGKLKIALFKRHEVLESGGSARLSPQEKSPRNRDLGSLFPAYAQGCPRFLWISYR